MASVSIFCPHCHQKTALSEALNPNRQAAVWATNPQTVWWIGICNGCNLPCLVKGDGKIVCPHPLPSPSDKDIPEAIRTDLDESKMCFSVKCFRACAVMARRCVQQACLEKGCKEGDKLVNQITELKQKGEITKDIEEWATVTRWIGNDAAHPNKETVTEDDATDALKLAEQFLHVLFVTPAVAKARRAKMGK